MSTDNIKYWECIFRFSEFNGDGNFEEHYKHIETGKTFRLTLNLDDAREKASWEETTDEEGAE